MRHVADGGAVGERQLRDSGAVKLNKFADDAELAKCLRDGENEIGGRCALAQFAGELVADNLRNEHRDGLSKHRRFGFDAADTPAKNAEAVDHGGVRVCADQCVRIGEMFAGDFGSEDDAGEIFEIDLVAASHAGRNGGEVAKPGLAPLEEGVALAVALELEERVGLVGGRRAVFVYLDRVIDHQFGGHQRVHALWIAAQGLNCIAHGGKIDDGGDAGEVLHEDAGGHVGDFAGWLGFRVPIGEEFDVGGSDVNAVFAAEQIFKQNFEADGKASEIEPAGAEGREAMDGVGAVAGGEHGF